MQRKHEEQVGGNSVFKRSLRFIWTPYSVSGTNLSLSHLLSQNRHEPHSPHTEDFLLGFCVSRKWYLNLHIIGLDLRKARKHFHNVLPSPPSHLLLFLNSYQREKKGTLKEKDQWWLWMKASFHWPGAPNDPACCWICTLSDSPSIQNNKNSWRAPL